MTDKGPDIPKPTPSVRFDWRDWEPYLEDIDVPENQKQELIETLWGIVLSFIDLGYEVSENKSACGQQVDLKSVLESAVLDLHTDRKAAANE